jgi:hypothetical protein
MNCVGKRQKVEAMFIAALAGVGQEDLLERGVNPR